MAQLVLNATGMPARHHRFPAPSPGAVGWGGWLPRLAALAAILLALLAVDIHPASAHEPWVLSKHEVETITHEPLPPLFATLNPINASIAILALGLMWVWLVLDRRSGGVALMQRTTARLRTYAGWIPLVLRLALSILMVWGASKGALFVPELDVQEAGAPGLVWAQVALAALLVTGFAPRLAALLVLALEASGLALFGWDIMPYAGVVAGPALYLLARGNGGPQPSHWTSRPWLASLQVRLWEQAHTVLRVAVGLNLIYLGIVFKYLTPGLFTAIVVRFHFPTFGLDPEVVTLLSAFVEAGAGLALVLGLLPRLTAVLLTVLFLVMTGLLQEDVSGHAILFGSALAIIIEGKEGLRRGQRTGSSQKDAPSMGLADALFGKLPSGPSLLWRQQHSE